MQVDLYLGKAFFLDSKPVIDLIKKVNKEMFIGLFIYFVCLFFLIVGVCDLRDLERWNS